ncbi:hypothetical protein CBS101457_002618 [Exobasidium rhododendri]|nr:hypothetical protein CBS101457_002618 [Exobasidium rhododendri]
MTTAHYLNQIAPVNLHSPRSYQEMSNGQGSNSNEDESFTFTVGKLDAGMAILIGDRASQIEFPSLLLPQECTTGSVVRISVSRNMKEEQRKKREFDLLQDSVLEMYGINAPVAPSLRLRAVTQTSITLEWDKLELATSKLLKLDIYRNGERLAAIPNPLHNTSTKLSGLEVDKPYTFHLVLKTSAGSLQSNIIKTKTHDMTDTSGISVCFGYIDGGARGDDGQREESEIETRAKELLDSMKAKYSDKIQIDTTHFVCTNPRSRVEGNETTSQMKGATFIKASQLSIPIVMPHWIFACAEQKKMVPISHYYLDKEPPNSASVRDFMHRRSTTANTPQSATSFPPTIDAARAPATTSEGAVEVPTLSTGGGSEEGLSLPPTPAAKDDVLPIFGQSSTQEERIEPAPHPEVEDIEGPITSTVAVGDAEAPVTASDSQGAIGTPDERMDEISLGGGSVKDYGDEEEVDLS